MFTATKKPRLAAAHAPAPKGKLRQLARALPEIPLVLRSVTSSNVAAPVGRTPIPAIVNRALSSPGQPLPVGEQTFMEQRFGHSFAAVRVHDDASAATSAQAISASAFTIGRDIFFAQDQFRPTSTSGRRLLAHELAHVVQNAGEPNTAAACLPATSLTVSVADDPREREAEILADHALAPAGLSRPVPGQRQAVPGLIQRSKGDTKPPELLDDPDVRAAIDAVWQASFGHPPFRSDILDPEDLPEAGEDEPSSAPQTPEGLAPEPSVPVETGHPSYREGKYEGVTFREAYFFIGADGKPTSIQVSQYPLDIKGVDVPSGAIAFVHTHPTQKRAQPSETGGTLVMAGMLLTDEQSARDLQIPVYSVASNTVLKTSPDLQSEVFSRRALAKGK